MTVLTIAATAREDASAESRLSILAIEINAAHVQVEAAVRSTLDHARRAGDLLIDVKALVPHGSWLPWLTEHCPQISERMAQHYMRIASEWERLANTKRVSEMAVREAVRALQTPRSDEWYTPADLVEAAREVMGAIDVDPASCAAANETVQASLYFTVEDDGLKQDWPGRVWLNPPYTGQARRFVGRLFDQFDAGITSAAVLLTHAVPIGDKWFRPVLERCPICVSRVPYIHDGMEKPSKNASVVAYLGPEPARFAEAFQRFGPVLRPWS